MPTCNHCQNQWTWKQTLRKTMTLNPAMTCPHCEKKQYQSQKSKTKIGLLNMFILIPLLLNIFFDIPSIILLSLIPIFAVIVFVVYPFLIELSSEAEFLF